jgi:ribosomal 30S subunit maturation factor RimM
MSKATNAAVFAAIIAAAAPAAYAQTRTLPETHVAAATHTMIQPDEIRASKMIGATVHDVQNRNIGSVKDLVLNRSGAADAVVVDVGSFLGMGGKCVAIPLRNWDETIESAEKNQHHEKNAIKESRYR